MHLTGSRTDFLDMAQKQSGQMTKQSRQSLLEAPLKELTDNIQNKKCNTCKEFFMDSNSYMATALCFCLGKCKTNKQSRLCVIKVCSNGGATYIIGEILAKDNLNITNLMQTFENLLL